MRIRSAVAAVTAVLAVSLVGCGGDHTDSKPDTAGSSAPAAGRTTDSGGVTPTDDDARHLNIGLRKTLCPEA